MDAGFPQLALGVFRSFVGVRKGNDWHRLIVLGNNAHAVSGESYGPTIESMHIGSDPGWFAARTSMEAASASMGWRWRVDPIG
jgi:hypothetical protein